MLGAAAIVAPILFHLIRRTSKEKQPFSSLMFLQPSPPRVTRRSRLENLLLLLLRCLVLFLLAFAFARPFLSRPVDINNDLGAGRKIVVMVDTSASMRREGAWPDAIKKTEEILKKAGRADRVSLFTFDRVATRLMTFEQWSQMTESERAALGAQRLAAVKPGWGGTRLGNALITAVEALEEADSEDTQEHWSGRREIVLISDLQAGADVDSLQAYEWPEGVELKIEPIKAKKESNAGLQLVAERRDGPREKEDQGPRVRISNSAASGTEQFQVGWIGGKEKEFIGGVVEAYVPPGQSRVARLPKPPEGVADARLWLSGDGEDYDNTAWQVAAKAQEIPVIYLGGEAESDLQAPLFYLKRAFLETKLEKIEIVARPAATPVMQTDLDRTRLVILTRGLAGNEAAALKAFMEQGSTVALVLRSADDASAIGALTGGGFPKAAEAEAKQYAMLGEIDFEHPLFAPFADPRFSDFTKIRFWKYRKLDLEGISGARAVARFDNGDPALTEIPVGKGSLLVLSSGWQPTDSLLARSSKFVPLLYAILENGGALRSVASQVCVGDEVAFDSIKSTETISIEMPNGKTATVEGGAKFTETLEPGIYTATAGTFSQKFAVNLVAGESKTEPLALDELVIHGATLSAPELTPEANEAKKRLMLKSQLENQQKLWRWLVVAALIVLIVESFVAGRLTRPTHA